MVMDYLNPLVLAALVVGVFLAIAVVQWWRERQYNLSGKTVLITGGSRGLGV